jgi:histidyl-tRNA synthetase
MQRSLSAIAGGGRYDKLVSLYGGPDTPAVGFAAGDVVIAELLQAKGIVIPPLIRSSVYIASFDAGHPHAAIQVTQKLRQAGIACEFSLTPGNIGKQLKLANAANAPLALFAGGDEERAGNFRIKDMRSGAESLCAADALVATIKTLLDAG